MTYFVNKYPKIFLLSIIYPITFFFISFIVPVVEKFLISLGYLGALVGGLMYSYSFTGSIGTIVFSVLGSSLNHIFTALIGGVAAAVSDITILKLFRKINFLKEFDHLVSEPWFRKLLSNFPLLKSKLFLTIIGLISIASPLPDELGIILIDRGKILSMRYLFIISIIANVIGIYTITLIG